MYCTRTYSKILSNFLLKDAPMLISRVHRLRFPTVVKNNCTYHPLHYPSNENDFAYNIISSDSNKYSVAKEKDFSPVNGSPSSVFNNIIYSQWNNQNPTEIFDAFISLSLYGLNNNIDVSSTMLVSLFSALEANLSKFDDTKLECILAILNRMPNKILVHSKPPILNLFMKLDNVLIERMDVWDTNKLLVFADYLYNTPLFKKIEYSSRVLATLASRAAQLTSAQLVQTLFLASSYRAPPPNLHNLEVIFKKYLDCLTNDEVAICCMGFFKSKSPLKDRELSEKIIDKVTKEADNISEISLGAMLKLIRYSTKVPNFKILFMLDRLAEQVPRLPLLGCLQVALVGTSILMVHHGALTAVVNKLIQSPSSARLKDLERLSFAVFTFNIETDPLFHNTILDELRSSDKEQQIHKHGSCFVNCLSYLAIKGVLPEDLISRVLQKEFIAHAYEKKTKEARALLVLDLSVEIELETYRGNRLNETLKKNLIAENKEFVPDVKHQNLNYNQKFLLEVMNITQRIRGGQKYVFTGHLLPHFNRADIVIYNDLKGKPMEVEKYFKEAPSSPTRIQRAPTAPGKWVVLMVPGRTCYTNNTRELLGTSQMKLRQLKKIGYSPATVSWVEWKNLKTDQDKIKYLTYIINSAT